MLSEWLFTEASLERSSEYERSRDATIRKMEELNTLRTKFEEMTVAQQAVSEKLAPGNIQVMLLFLPFSIKTIVCSSCNHVNFVCQFSSLGKE